MGNLLGKSSANYDQQISELKQQIENMQVIDTNNDGVVSKEEFNHWLNNDFENLKVVLKKEGYTEATRDINDMKLKIESLEQINKELEEKLKEKNKMIQKLGSNIKNDQDVDNLIKLLSNEKIDKYVEDLLEDENINIKYLPDYVEKQIYRNIFKFMFKMMNKVLGTLSFELIGHKLNVNMIPNDKFRDMEFNEGEEEKHEESSDEIAYSLELSEPSPIVPNNNIEREDIYSDNYDIVVDKD